MRISIREALFSGEEVENWDPSTRAIPANIQELINNNEEFRGWEFIGTKDNKPFTGPIKAIRLDSPDPSHVNSFISPQANKLNNTLTKIVFQLAAGWIRLSIDFWTINIDEHIQTITAIQTPEDLARQASFKAEMDRIAMVDLLAKLMWHRDAKCTSYADRLNEIIKPGDEIDPEIQKALTDTTNAKAILDEKVRMNDINSSLDVLAGKTDWVEKSGDRLYYYRVAAAALFKTIKPTDVIPDAAKAGLKEVLANNATLRIMPEVIDWIQGVV